MKKDSSREKCVTFFQEAIDQWSRLTELFNALHKTSFHSVPRAKILEANKIIAWFQENYSQYIKFSDFGLKAQSEDGKKTDVDPVFDVVFRGANIETVCAYPEEYIEEINGGVAYLRGHLGSVRNSRLSVGKDAALSRVERILLRYHLVANQLLRARKGKKPYTISDEYDVQGLLHAILKVDFDDIRVEEWVPSYAGGSSRIDLVLKNENALIEVKKASGRLKEKQIGEQLIIDISRYKEYPGVSRLICFVYDPEQQLSNPKGLENDLMKLSTQRLKIKVIVCPRSV